MKLSNQIDSINTAFLTIKSGQNLSYISHSEYGLFFLSDDGFPRKTCCDLAKVGFGTATNHSTDSDYYC